MSVRVAPDSAHNATVIAKRLGSPPDGDQLSLGVGPVTRDGGSFTEAADRVRDVEVADCDGPAVDSADNGVGLIGDVGRGYRGKGLGNLTAFEVGRRPIRQGGELVREPVAAVGVPVGREAGFVGGEPRG